MKYVKIEDVIEVLAKFDLPHWAHIVNKLNALPAESNEGWISVDDMQLPKHKERVLAKRAMPI